MGSSPDSPPKNPKPNVVMGYPTPQDNNKYPAAPPPPPAPPSHPKAGCEAQLPQPSPYQQQPPYPNPYNHPPSPYNLYATSTPYQPYPPPPPYQHDPNYMSQPPYNDYYYHHHEPTGSASFGRVLLVLLLMLLSSFLMMSLIMWILFGASVPEFEVASIKVSNFSTANASVSGAWAVQVWVSNVNMELNVRFDHGMSSVFYKDSMIGVAALEPFDVRKSQRFGLNFNVPALPDQKWVPPTLAEDRAAGVVVVSLRLAVDANFTGTEAVYRHERLRILCDDLPIKFASPATGEGTLSSTFGSHCYIRLREGRE